MKQQIKSAIGYAAAFLLLLFTEIVIGIYGLGIVRAYIGDVLVIPLLYCLIRIFTKALPRTLPLCLFGVGCLAELLQLIRLSDLLGFPRGSLPSILIGTSASWWDVLCYAIGSLLIYGVMLLIHGITGMPKTSRRITSVLTALAVTAGTAFWCAQMAITYRFDYDPDWMMDRSLAQVQERYIRYDAQVCRDTALEAQGYVFIAQECYFHDVISSAGNFYYLYYVKCNENNIVTDVQVVDTGIGG